MHPAAGVVGDQVVRNRGALPPGAQDRERAGVRDIVDVVSDQVAVWPLLTIAGDRAVDIAGIARGQRFVIDPQPLGDAWTELLDQYVAALLEAQEDLLARG